MPKQNQLFLPVQTPIDIHCHRYANDGHFQILSRDVHELTNHSDGTLPNPLTLTGQTSWQAQADLQPFAGYFSLGIHPWFIECQTVDTAFQTFARYEHHPKLLAIGECGLDKCIDTAMDKQIDIFTYQIKFAERIGKPLIVHCVRAYAELLQLKKSLAPTHPWIIHGFTGKPALAAQLLKHGCYLSFGKALLPAGSQASLAFKSSPINRLFLETDAADASIDTIYAAAAKIRGVDLANLRHQIHTNFINVFFND